MRRAWILSICALGLAPTPAAAQQSDTQQILEMLRDMNGRFDQIEERLDRVEQGGAPAASATPDAATSAPAPAPVQPASNGVAVPGWKIDVLPYTDKGPADAPIARVRAPIGPTYFNLHFDGGPVSNQVSYKGSAYLKVSEPGTYVIQLRTETSNQGWSRECGGLVSIEDREIIPMFESSSSVTKSGSIDLQSGNYLINYRTFCVLSSNSLSTSLNRRNIEGLKQSGYELKILGPSDETFRPFEPSELFFIAPPEKPRAQLEPDEPVAPRDDHGDAGFSQAAAYAPEPGSGTGFGARRNLGKQAPVALGFRAGILIQNANFRSAPSRSSHSMRELRAGLGFRVLEQVDSWYRVRLRNGNEGYVHTSLVALQN